MKDAAFVAALAEETTKALDALRTTYLAELAAVRSDLEAFKTEHRNAPIIQPPDSAAISAEIVKQLEVVVRGEMERIERAAPTVVSIVGASVREGSLFVRLTDGTEQDAGRVSGEKGVKGDDGKDAVLDVAALANEVVALVPLPKDGKDGEKGDPGVDGKDAVLDMDTLALEVASLVPLPKDGKDGLDGKDADPVDRVTLAKDVLALIPVPRDGKDGKDGIPSFDDLRAEVAKSKVELRDELPALAKAAVVETRAEDPWPVYREIWREGDFEKGAVVTWAGSAWIAMEATNEKPGDGATKWKLFVKQGRDGRDARPVPVRL